MTTNARPQYHWGVIAPARGDEAGETDSRAESLLPPEVVTLSNVLGIRDYTSEGVEEAMARYPDCVRDLVSRGAQRVCLNGIPISVQLGRPRVLELIKAIEKLLGSITFPELRSGTSQSSEFRNILIARRPRNLFFG